MTNIFGQKPTVESISQIVKEQFWPLLVAGLVSTVGGIAAELISKKLYFLLPVLIMLPALADMVGDFSTIIASKSTALVEEGLMPHDYLHSKRILKLAGHMFWLSLIYSMIIALVSMLIAHLQGFILNNVFIVKFITTVAAIDILLVLFLLLFSLRAAGWVAYKNRDPDNFLIPLATSIADAGVLGLFSLLVWLFF